MYISRLAEKKFEEYLKSSKILIVLGARQVGKTTLVNHILAGKNVHFLNLDVQLNKQSLINIAALDPADSLRSLGSPEILVIDEAQRLPETGQIIKGWHDFGLPLKVILLGSSSLDLLNKSAESLTGRNEKLFLPPLTFLEIIKIQPWYLPALSNQQLVKGFPAQLKQLLIETIVFGSYPEIVQALKRTELLFTLISDYLLKDTFQLGLVKSPETIRRLLILLAYQVGSVVSINELANNLRIARPTVERYLNLLEETFVIFRLPAFSSNPRKEISKSQKIYFWDTGVRNTLINEFSLNESRSDIGQLWENWVVAEFAKQNMLSGFRKNLFFWRSKSGSEIDLIVKKDENLEAYEIKWQKKLPKKMSFIDRYQTKIQVIDHTNPFFNF